MFSLKSKEHQIKQLELELDQERRMAESLVEDMVINYHLTKVVGLPLFGF